ncbi:MULTISPECIES: D-TA family PLP-dependent enzyme [unclassified Arthrobacter]|uniref:D-TA family PLP-dependent enzyme n=1 Tax=unclassified Arthrobacter TaxID=235627 RepID=UPI0014912AE8|nr:MULTISPECIES: D-TA family PLP-dependent enzyme [unclassified Arthrobacter]MBE0009638.1 D-TA family PLP-dependent enzyme [Arthrobacter sp. AET 35A]NOJ63391.1 D-TA family PLP-dependent enzyme [Arthrobacter sp. 147(2020)]
MSAVPAGIETPEVLIDRDILERNIDRMATAVRAKGIDLRPHVKTHKMPEIASRQLAAGAVGLTVATIGEAEVFVQHGARDVFIAYPLWVTPHHARRLAELGSLARVAVGTDSVEAAQAMGAALSDATDRIEVLVEIDSGHHRSGVSPSHAVEVAESAAAAGLRVSGVFTFPGHSYAPGMPVKAAEQEHFALEEAASLLRSAGFDISRISGGSTPTAALAVQSSANEVRPGVYVFGDAQQLELGRCTLDEIALTIAATVVSRHQGAGSTPRRCVLDAGSKIIGSDRPAWASGFGRLMDYPEARISALSEHHATVIWPDGSELPALGARLRVIPNHVCLTMNLVDEATVVSGDAVIARWRVDARGKNN